MCFINANIYLTYIYCSPLVTLFIIIVLISIIYDSTIVHASTSFIFYIILNLIFHNQFQDSLKKVQSLSNKIVL